MGDLAREFKDKGSRDLTHLFGFLVIWTGEPHRKQGRGLFVDKASARRLRAIYTEYLRRLELEPTG